MTNLLNPIAEEVNAFLMIKSVWSYSNEIRFCVKEFSKGLDVDVLVKIEVAYSALLFFETFSPTGCVDELYPQLMKLSGLKTDDPHEESFRFKRTGD